MHESCIPQHTRKGEYIGHDAFIPADARAVLRLAHQRPSRGEEVRDEHVQEDLHAGLAEVMLVEDEDRNHDRETSQH